MAQVNKYWWRLLIVFLFHIIIKSFDLSFPGGPFELNLRSLVFSIFFIGYGMIIWILGDWFNKIVKKRLGKISNHIKKLFIMGLVHSFFGYILVVSLNHFYRLGDTYLFDLGPTWKSINYLNPEMTISLLGFYLIVLSFDGYLNSQKKLQEGLLKAEQFKKESVMAQYRALKAQIEPHFLFNNLSVLSSLVYKDADLSADFIVKLSKTLRYIIEKMNSI